MSNQPGEPCFVHEHRPKRWIGTKLLVQALARAPTEEPAFTPDAKLHIPHSTLSDGSDVGIYCRRRKGRAGEPNSHAPSIAGPISRFGKAHVERGKDPYGGCADNPFCRIAWGFSRL